jgi:hypothetical protein
MKIRNVSPIGDLDFPMLGRIVAAGEVIEVPDEVGAALLDQPANWAAVKSPTKSEKE